jgi:hypothetical protein
MTRQDAARELASPIAGELGPNRGVLVDAKGKRDDDDYAR